MSETIVITGTSSFVGCHLAQQFAHSGWHVIGTVAPFPDEYEGIRGERLRYAEQSGVELQHLDFTLEKQLQHFVLENKPDIWLHHGAWATAYSSPDYDLTRGLHVNAIALELLYKSLSDIGCRGIIHTGTSWEYGNVPKPYLENGASLPSTPYGLAKLVQTLRAKQLASYYNLSTRVARIFIPYGLRDAPSKLLPNVIRALQDGEPIDLTPCEQKRDFLFVGDLLDGYEAVVKDINRNTFFEIFNLCSGEAVALKDLLLKIARLLKADTALLRFGRKPMRVGEEMIEVGSREKAERLLGWIPQSLEVGLGQYVELK